MRAPGSSAESVDLLRASYETGTQALPDMSRLYAGLGIQQVARVYGFRGDFDD